MCTLPLLGSSAEIKERVQPYLSFTYTAVYFPAANATGVI